jgi:hypothetical protein
MLGIWFVLLALTFVAGFRVAGAPTVSITRTPYLVWAVSVVLLVVFMHLGLFRGWFTQGPASLVPLAAIGGPLVGTLYRMYVLRRSSKVS